VDDPVVYDASGVDDDPTGSAGRPAVKPANKKRKIIINRGKNRSNDNRRKEGSAESPVTLRGRKRNHQDNYVDGGEDGGVGQLHSPPPLSVWPTMVRVLKRGGKPKYTPQDGDTIG
jgi:hypothetical protein